MAIPALLHFEGLDGPEWSGSRHTWRRVDRRAPRKGEWYVSGAEPVAYRMPNDAPLSFVMAIVEPVAKMIPRTVTVYVPA